MANYLTIGYLEDGRVVELAPGRSAHVVDATTGTDLTDAPGADQLIDDVVAYYQAAAVELRDQATSRP